MEKIKLSELPVGKPFKFDNGEIYTKTATKLSDKIGAIGLDGKEYFFNKETLVVQIENPRDDQYN
jgi:hypothetical protein